MLWHPKNWGIFLLCYTGTSFGHLENVLPPWVTLVLRSVIDIQFDSWVTQQDQRTLKGSSSDCSQTQNEFLWPPLDHQAPMPEKGLPETGALSALCSSYPQSLCKWLGIRSHCHYQDTWQKTHWKKNIGYSQQNDEISKNQVLTHPLSIITVNVHRQHYPVTRYRQDDWMKTKTQPQVAYKKHTSKDRDWKGKDGKRCFMLMDIRCEQEYLWLDQIK